MRPVHETLEPRRLLSGGHASGIYARVDAKSTLRVFGTDGDDRVAVRLDADGRFVVSLGDRSGTPSFAFGRGELRAIRMYLGGGDDAVEMVGDAGEAFDGPMIVDAGAGRDSIETGAGDDRIDGGSGADDLRGGGGSDTIDAGRGNDRIRTGGNDERYGSDGGGDGAGDIVYGRYGDDRIYTADRGRTEVEGNDGDDTLFSGAGADRFYGGFGANVIDYSGRRENLLIDIAFFDPLRRPGENVRYDAQGNIIGFDPPPIGQNGGLLDDGRTDAEELAYDARSARNTGHGRPAKPPRFEAHALPASEGLAGTGGLELDRITGVQQVIGGRGDDVIRGTFGPDTLRGGVGDDTIFAGAGADDIYGDAGDDSIFAADARDASRANVYDRFGVLNAADRIDGGPGRDFARVDAHDLAKHRSSIETTETLRSLTS